MHWAIIPRLGRLGESGQKMPARRRVLQQFTTRFFPCQRLKQLLILQRSREESFALGGRQGSGGVPSQEFLYVFPLHRFVCSQSPPISSNRCLRQRWSHV